MLKNHASRRRPRLHGRSEGDDGGVTLLQRRDVASPKPARKRYVFPKSATKALGIVLASVGLFYFICTMRMTENEGLSADLHHPLPLVSYIIRTSEPSTGSDLSNSTVVRSIGARSKKQYESERIGILTSNQSRVLLKLISGRGSGFHSPFSHFDPAPDDGRPSLKSVLEAVQRNLTSSDPTSNIQSLLDFAIIGFGKCGTTTLVSWLQQHENISVYPDEIYDLMHDDLPTFLRRLYTLRVGRGILRGYKSPHDITFYHVLQKYFAEYFPSTKLVIGLRHPIRWFESLYSTCVVGVMLRIGRNVVQRNELHLVELTLLRAFNLPPPLVDFRVQNGMKDALPVSQRLLSLTSLSFGTLRFRST
jgi:hypothetical protein